MQETRAVKDLAIGDIIQVDGFEDGQVVRNAKKIRKGLDAGLLEVTLVAPDGDTERIALDPEGPVTVVGKDPEAGKGKSAGAMSMMCAPRSVISPPPQDAIDSKD